MNHIDLIHRQVRVASVSSDSAFSLLESYRNQFAGIEWMPANLLKTNQILNLNTYLDTFYEDIGQVDFSGLPSEASLTKDHYKMWLEIRLARRWMYRNHIQYLTHMSLALSKGQSILERLRKLTLSGRVVRETVA